LFFHTTLLIPGEKMRRILFFAELFRFVDWRWAMKVKFKKVLLIAVAGVLAGVFASPVKADTISYSGPELLSYYISGGHELQIGNLVFDFLSGVGTDGAPSAGAITVTQANPAAGELGVTFSASWSGGDTNIQYTVTAVNGVLIDDDYMSVAGSVSPLWTVSEAVTPTSGSLGEFNLPTMTSTNPVDNTDFGPYQSLFVNKDISSALGGSISSVTQAFSTVPLPSAVVGGIGLIAVVGWNRIRRLAQNNT
jgi:hypothetical protein